MAIIEVAQQEGLVVPKEAAGDSPVVGKLIDLTQEAQLDMDKLRALDLSSRKNLLRWYKTTDRFAEIYQEALKFELTPRTDEERNENRNYLAGRVFQDLAYFFLVRREIEERSSRVILSPEQTLEFWKSIFPKKQVAQNPFSTGSLMGIHVPDGMVVDPVDHRVIALCEYSLTRSDESIKKRTLGIALARNDIPEIGTGARFVMVTPRSYYNGIGFDENIKLPIEHSQFKNFVDGIYQHYQTFKYGDEDGAATLDDIQKEVKYQAQRAEQGRKDGAILTRGYKGPIPK